MTEEQNSRQVTDMRGLEGLQKLKMESVTVRLLSYNRTP